MNKLPKDLINYIQSFAPEHRGKYKHVLNQLTVLKDSSLIDRIIYLARGKLYFQNKELNDINNDLMDDEDMASFEEYQERLIEYLEIKYDKKKKEPFSSGRSKWKDLYWAIDNKFTDHCFQICYPGGLTINFEEVIIWEKWKKLEDMNRNESIDKFIELMKKNI